MQGRQGPAVTVMRRLGYVAQLLGDLGRVPVGCSCRVLVSQPVTYHLIVIGARLL